MNTTSFAGPAAVRGVVLPARAAYLVGVGSRAGVRRAVQEASTRWGGATEPIISVRKGGRVDRRWKQVLRAARVDGLVNVDAGESGDAFAAKLRMTVVPIDEIDLWGTTSATTHPSHVGGFVQHQTPVIASSPDAPLWEAVAAGDITEDHQMQLRDVDVALLRSRPDGVARAQLDRGATLLDRTLVQFEEHCAMNLPPAGSAVVWVTAPDAVRDCVAFWNLRAIRSLRFSYAPMVLLPDRDVEHWVHYRDQFQWVLARPADFAPDVLVVSAGVPKERRRELARLLGLTRTTEKVRAGRSAAPKPARTAPFTYRDDVVPWGWVLNDREYGKISPAQLFVHEGRAAVRIISPVRFTGSGQTLLRVDSDAFAALPRQPVIADAIHRNATWSGRWLQFVTRATDEYALDLTVPSLPECVTLLLRQRATTHQLSDKGRLGAPLLRDIDVTRLLEPGVVEAIAALTTPRAPALERELRRARDAGLPENAIRDLAARWGGRHDRRHRAAHDMGDPNAVRALEELCRLGWAERGLQSDCDHCGLRQFVPLDAIRDGASCPGCRADATFTATTTGVGIRYRLNTFVDRASDQGVIPHLAAIAVLEARAQRSFFLAGTDVTFADGEASEVDLVGIMDGRVVAGEVKTKPRDFTARQIARDVALSTKLGADVHVLAANGDVPDGVRAKATKAAAAAGLELLILDRAALRPPAS